MIIDFTRRGLSMDLRQKIIEQATMLFLKFGIKSITMDAIAQSLGISKRTIYELFPNKDCLLKECIASRIQAKNEMFNAAKARSDSSLDFMIYALRNEMLNYNAVNPMFLAEIKKSHPEIYQKHITVEKKRTIDLYQQAIVDLISDGIFRPGISPYIAAIVLVELSHGVSVRVTALNTEMDEVKIFDNLIINFIKGLCSPKGLSLLNQSIAVEKIISEIRDKN